ncbi:tRNA CCA-pyrophosphorylase, partial [mine drainage metagenome]
MNYAEHPYIKITRAGSRITADIVPAFKINDASEMASAVDRTPLHNAFVNSNLNDREKDQVRVLKYFLQQHYIYGAEARIGGFSGYLCELLVYHFGDFSSVVNYFAESKLPIVLDYNKGREKEKRESIAKEFNSRFVVVDPTDRNRNVAAAVSLESLARMAVASRNLISNPNKNGFYRKGYSDEDAVGWILRLRDSFGLDLHTISVTTESISEDTLWPQLSRLKRNLLARIKTAGFEVFLSAQGLSGKRAVISIITERCAHGAELRRGPSVFDGSNAHTFYKSHKGSVIIIDGERLHAIKIC